VLSAESPSVRTRSTMDTPVSVFVLADGLVPSTLAEKDPRFR
jgi:hypothetical protein